MRERTLPKKMRFTLREYFQASRHVHQINDDGDLLAKMSPLLLGNVAVAANKKWLDRVWCAPAPPHPHRTRISCVGLVCADSAVLVPQVPRAAGGDSARARLHRRALAAPRARRLDTGEGHSEGCYRSELG